MNSSPRVLVLILGLLAAVLAPLQGAQVRAHDPVIIKEAGTYYLFTTGPGVPFYSSTDLKTWERRGRIFPGAPSWTKDIAPGFDGNVWAPDVIFRDGRFHCFYTVSAPGKITSAIGVATTRTLDPASPDYAWTDHGIVIRSVAHRDLWNAIDPHVIVDEQGTGWMSFGSFWGGLKLFKLNDRWTAPAEPPEWHSLAKRERSVLVNDEEPEPAAIEAPFIFKKGDDYFLFVSWDYCCRGKNSTYRIMVGRAKDFRGPYVDRSGKKLSEGGGTLVLDGTAAWPGVGHNSAYTFDGKDYLVLHAYETADKYLQKLKVLDMKWDQDGWPTVDPKDLNRYKSSLQK